MGAAALALLVVFLAAALLSVSLSRASEPSLSEAWPSLSPSDSLVARFLAVVRLAVAFFAAGLALGFAAPLAGALAVRVAARPESEGEDIPPSMKRLQECSQVHERSGEIQQIATEKKHTKYSDAGKCTFPVLAVLHIERLQRHGDIAQVQRTSFFSLDLLAVGLRVDPVHELLELVHRRLGLRRARPAHHLLGAREGRAEALVHFVVIQCVLDVPV